MLQAQTYNKFLIFTRYLRVFSIRAVLSGFFRAYTQRAAFVLYAQFVAFLLVFRVFMVIISVYIHMYEFRVLDLFIAATFQTISIKKNKN